MTDLAVGTSVKVIRKINLRGRDPIEAGTIAEVLGTHRVDYKGDPMPLLYTVRLPEHRQATNGRIGKFFITYLDASDVTPAT